MARQLKPVVRFVQDDDTDLHQRIGAVCDDHNVIPSVVLATIRTDPVVHRYFDRYCRRRRYRRPLCFPVQYSQFNHERFRRGRLRWAPVDAAPLWKILDDDLLRYRPDVAFLDYREAGYLEEIVEFVERHAPRVLAITTTRGTEIDQLSARLARYVCCDRTTAVLKKTVVAFGSWLSDDDPEEHGDTQKSRRR